MKRRQFLKGLVRGVPLAAAGGLALKGGEFSGEPIIGAGGLEVKSPLPAALTFSSDADTGIYRYSSDTLIFSTNGEELMRL